MPRPAVAKTTSTTTTTMTKQNTDD
jgi:hypothetical protein